jgi:hypothetical protein
MERYKKFFLLAVSLGLLGVIVTVFGTKQAHALIATMVQVVNSASNPVPVAGTVNMPTHLGQNPSSLITLECIVVTCTQQFADGSTTGSVYTIPAGDELVVTDIDWRVSDPSKNAGDSVTFHLYAGGHPIYDTVGTNLLPDHSAAGADHLTSGIVLSVTPSTDSPPTNGTVEVFLRGYLVPAPIIITIVP